MSSDRHRPLQPSECAPETRELLEFAGQGGEPPATMALLAHTDGLLKPFLRWAGTLALSGALSRRDQELLALRAAYRMGSTYEWDEHSDMAAEAGLTASEIAAVGTPENTEPWTEVEQALLGAADELIATGEVSDATYATLAAQYPPSALVEVPMVVGQYTMLSMLCGFFAID